VYLLWLKTAFKYSINKIKEQLNNRMTYSTFIHSGIVNPKKTSIKEETAMETVVIEYDLLVDILEQAEDSKSRKELLEKIKELKDTGVLNKKSHGEAFALQKIEDTKTLEAIKKLAGM